MKKIKLQYSELKGKVQELDKILTKLKDYTDLKLHYASYYCWKNDIDGTFFDLFCNYSFLDFEDFLKELDLEYPNDFDFIRRSSSFYCLKDRDISIDLFELLENLKGVPFFEFLFDYIYPYVYTESSLTDLLEMFEKYLKDKLFTFYRYMDFYSGSTFKERIIQSLEDSIEEIDYLIDKVKQYEKAFDYIQYFKKNQVEYFQEFLKNYE